VGAGSREQGTGCMVQSDGGRHGHRHRTTRRTKEGLRLLLPPIDHRYQQTIVADYGRPSMPDPNLKRTMHYLRGAANADVDLAQYTTHRRLGFYAGAWSFEDAPAAAPTSLLISRARRAEQTKQREALAAATARSARWAGVPDALDIEAALPAWQPPVPQRHRMAMPEAHGAARRSIPSAAAAGASATLADGHILHVDPQQLPIKVVAALTVVAGRVELGLGVPPRLKYHQRLNTILGAAQKISAKPRAPPRPPSGAKPTEPAGPRP